MGKVVVVVVVVLACWDILAFESGKPCYQEGVLYICKFPNGKFSVCLASEIKSEYSDDRLKNGDFCALNATLDRAKAAFYKWLNENHPALYSRINQTRSDAIAPPNGEIGIQAIKEVASVLDKGGGKNTPCDNNLGINTSFAGIAPAMVEDTYADR
jgi:hypothetical protein